MVPPLIPEIFILSNLNKDGPPDDIYLENKLNSSGSWHLLYM